jgi:hypothetical protein
MLHKLKLRPLYPARPLKQANGRTAPDLEIVLDRHSISSQKHRTCFGEANEDRHMSRHVSTGLDQINARQGRGIAIDKTVTLCWQIPVWTRGREALVPSTSHIILLSLHHQFCLWEVLVMAAMVKIEMSTIA